MKLVYYILLKPLSYLPDWFIHRLSDFACFVLFYLIPYRKKLVVENLRNSFPEKSHQEVKVIAFKFYRQFCDTMLEMLKNFSISHERAEHRVRVTNPEVLDEFHAKGKSIIITGGHYGNWEALTLTAGKMRHDFYGLFTPISNKFMEEKITASRSKFGFNMVSTKKYKDKLIEDYSNPRAFVFAIDQAPRRGSGHWMRFLNQDTAVLFGTEKTAKEFNLPVVMGRMEPAGRGRHELTYETLTEEPRSFAQDGQLTEFCMRKLEVQIRKSPHNWLWTHKRWKHKR